MDKNAWMVWTLSRNGNKCNVWRTMEAVRRYVLLLTETCGRTVWIK